MTLRRGALVILEGCDRSGKTTQAGMLVDALNAKNVPAKLLKFPSASLSLYTYFTYLHIHTFD